MDYNREGANSVKKENVMQRQQSTYVCSYGCRHFDCSGRVEPGNGSMAMNPTLRQQRSEIRKGVDGMSARGGVDESTCGLALQK